MEDSIEQATIKELRRQRDEALDCLRDCQSLVAAIPGIIASARLDEAEKKATKYDYDRHARCFRVRT